MLSRLATIVSAATCWAHESWNGGGLTLLSDVTHCAASGQWCGLDGNHEAAMLNSHGGVAFMP